MHVFEGLSPNVRQEIPNAYECNTKRIRIQTETQTAFDNGMLRWVVIAAGSFDPNGRVREEKILRVAILQTMSGKCNCKFRPKRVEFSHNL